MNKKFIRATSIVSLIVGAVLAVFSLFGFIGLLILYLSKKPINLDQSAHIITWIIVLLSFYVAYFGYKRFEGRKGFYFYNAIILAALAIATLTSDIVLTIKPRAIELELLTIFSNIIFTVIHSISFILNGIGIIKKPSRN